MMISRRGFTLIELIVVVVIICILASVAVPMMKGFRNRAIMTEAMTAIYALRTALKNYYMEYNSYPASIGGNLVAIETLPAGKAMGIRSDDYVGAYFIKSDEGFSAYWIMTDPSGARFDITCNVKKIGMTFTKEWQALLKDPNQDGYIKVDQDGTILQSNLVDTGYKNYGE